MSQPKFSIIIPTLNEEKLLPKLLDQFNDEDLRKEFNFEIIISDGGSKDNTLKVAEKFGTKIISSNGNNENIARGRNRGAEDAESDYLIFLNGDVRVSNVRQLFTLIEIEFQNIQTLAITCPVKVFPEETKFIDRVFQTFYNNYFHLLNIIAVGMGRGECHIIRKEIFNNVGGYNETLAAGEDFDLYKRIRKLGGIVFTRKFEIYESPRRYRKYGHFTIFFRWLLNSIFVIIMKKSLSKEWEQVR